MNDLEQKFSVYNDYKQYIEENEKIIHFLRDNDSMLNTYVSPIIKSIGALKAYVDGEDRELNQEEINIVEFGFNYLFENLEQIKLYLKQFNGDLLALESKSYLINIIFELEEYKEEIEKDHELDQSEKEQDLKQINAILTYLESILTVENHKESELLNAYIQKFYDLKSKYKDVVVAAHAFEEYCAEFGI
ncbi:hypothetical protein [Haloplasma contractile]|uniref:Uncharacterized protein n=1 Tax=Haloplasma contractile SSD-17B TaxID=1033810 RepID=U2EFH3_9MOLU|nr:hypothetical protein [Haloplasma contractile]ERJ13683.1 hypothetical protein HLPCO_000349 [Haloplasma contractile SSD-17B]